VNEVIDYAEVGLRAGLEVHQQLLTERKLFCNCPAGLYTKTHDGVVLRHMRPTLSELGEYDGTALMEFKTKKNIVYLLHQSNVCTYESLMLGCDIIDETHIARKQYLDGSIPTGFQRTAIVGVNGRLPFRGRELSITQVSIEEDSCREVSDRGHLIVWRADRLGMPLIETVTGPDLRTPEEVEEAILLIGRVCRSTGHVRVGIGASRQDVNVSVRGGRRVEIKGVPQAWWARRLVHGEAVRQVNLLRLRDELHGRGFRLPEDLGIEHRDVTRMFASSALRRLRQEAWEDFLEQEGRRPGFERGEGPFCVRAVKLPGLAGTLRWPTQPDYTFAHELAGRVRVVATLDHQPILFHSEKWPDYEGSKQDLRRLKRAMHCGSGDSLVVVRGALQDTITAAEEIRLRYVDALDGVPNETRQPFPDGSTDFERILPGPDRMYPDTDSPPQRVTRERVEQLQLTLPEPPWEREERYSAVDVPRTTIHFLIRRGGARLVDLVVERSGADLRRTCFFFGEWLKGLRRAGVVVDGIGDELWCELFAAASERPILWEARKQIVVEMAADPQRTVASIVADGTLGVAPEGWSAQLDETVRHGRVLHSELDSELLLRHLMRHAMAGLRGKVPAVAVSQALARAMEELE